METKELLLQLIKKLESGEIGFGTTVRGVENRAENPQMFYLLDESKKKVIVGEWNIIVEKGRLTVKEADYKEEWNEEFKENFYKEKGVKCWVKDCPNKILVEEGDHKKVKVPCNEKHTRLVCVDCSEKYDRK